MSYRIAFQPIQSKIGLNVTFVGNVGATPTEFEKYCVQLLNEQFDKIHECKLQHNIIICADDGNYQIDGYIEFSVHGITYKTLVECKHYKSSISREKVQILYDKLRATGAQKGILISISNFQSGAIDFATKHGIALVQIIKSGVKYHARSKFGVIVNKPNAPYNFGCPYVGVMQHGTDGMTHCSYLKFGNMKLRDFILNGF